MLDKGFALCENKTNVNKYNANCSAVWHRNER